MRSVMTCVDRDTNPVNSKYRTSQDGIHFVKGENGERCYRDERQYCTEFMSANCFVDTTRKGEHRLFQTDVHQKAQTLLG